MLFLWMSLCNTAKIIYLAKSLSGIKDLKPFHVILMHVCVGGCVVRVRVCVCDFFFSGTLNFLFTAQKHKATLKNPKV